MDRVRVADPVPAVARVAGLAVAAGPAVVAVAVVAGPAADQVRELELAPVQDRAALELELAPVRVRGPVDRVPELARELALGPVDPERVREPVRVQDRVRALEQARALGLVDPERVREREPAQGSVDWVRELALVQARVA